MFCFQEKKNLKKLAKSVSHKVDKVKKSVSKTNLSGGKDSKEYPSNPSYGSGAAAAGDAATLPSKFNPKDMDNMDFSFNNPSKSRSSFHRMGSGRRNQDPGVQSDDEDDMFKVRPLPKFALHQNHFFFFRLWLWLCYFLLS